MAQRYKRFEKEINRLADFIRWQLRSSEAKQAAIVDGFSPLALDELCEETRLDRLSVLAEVAVIEKNGTVEKRDPDGEHVVMRDNGRPTRSVYYRLAREISRAA